MPNRGHAEGGHAGRHWTPLTPTRNYAARLYVTLGLGAILLLLAAVTARQHSTGGLVALIVFLVGGVGSMGFAVYTFLVFRNLEDAKVHIDKPELVLGQSFHVRVEQRARRGLYIQEMRVALVCQETVRQAGHGPAGASPDAKSTRTVPLLEKWETLTREKKIDHARMLSATRAFRIPDDHPASSPIDQKKLPLIRWKLRVVTTAAHAPTYDVDFPVHVHPTPSAGFWKEIQSDEVPSIRRV